jgi:hypothetical protein
MVGELIEVESGRQDVDGQLVGVRIVDCHELHAGFHEGRHEGEVSGQPIKLRDDQPRLVIAAGALVRSEIASRSCSATAASIAFASSGRSDFFGSSGR